MNTSSGSRDWATLRAVLDTNVFVGAGFRGWSASAALLAAAREGDFLLMWSPSTRAETEAVLRRIPPLRGSDVGDVFVEAGLVADVDIAPEFEVIGDATDRKFAALAAKAGAVLVSADRDLLDVRAELARLGVEVLSAGQFRRRLENRIDRP